MVGKIIEFLVGFFLISFVVNVLGGIFLLYLLPTLGISAYLFLALWAIRIIVLLILFWARKTIAFGYLLALVLNVILGSSLLELIIQ